MKPMFPISLFPNKCENFHKPHFEVTTVLKFNRSNAQYELLNLRTLWGQLRKMLSQHAASLNIPLVLYCLFKLVTHWFYWAFITRNTMYKCITFINFIYMDSSIYRSLVTKAVDSLYGYRVYKLLWILLLHFLNDNIMLMNSQIIHLQNYCQEK